MKKKGILIVVIVLLVPVLIYVGSVAYATYPCVDDVGTHYAPVTLINY